MVLTDIIALSSLLIFAAAAFYVLVAFIIFKFKNRGKINPHLKKTIIDKVSAVAEKPRPNNLIIQKPLNNYYDNMNKVAGYIDGRPVIYVNDNNAELIYRENILRQNYRKRQPRPKHRKVYQKHEIRFN